MLLWSTWTPLTTMPTSKIFDVHELYTEMNKLYNSVEYNRGIIYRDINLCNSLFCIIGTAVCNHPEFNEWIIEH